MEIVRKACLFFVLRFRLLLCPCLILTDPHSPSIHWLISHVCPSLLCIHSLLCASRKLAYPPLPCEHHARSITSQVRSAFSTATVVIVPPRLCAYRHAIRSPCSSIERTCFSLNGMAVPNLECTPLSLLPSLLSWASPKFAYAVPLDSMIVPAL